MICNCESSYCAHTRIGNGQCPNSADGSHTMLYVGAVCAACAQVAIDNDGAHLVKANDFNR